MVGFRKVGFGYACNGSYELVGNVDGSEVEDRDHEFALSFAVALEPTKMSRCASTVASGFSITSKTSLKTQGSGCWRLQRPKD